MNLSTLFPDDETPNLKCSTCNNYLSYFPVFSNNNQHICGRCTVSDLSLSRNLPYETLAQLIKFPCRYEGCFEQFLPEDIPAHESNCPWKTICCPCSCVWQGARPHLLQHCQNKHGENFLQNGKFKLNLEINTEQENLVEHEGMLFIFKREFDALSRTMLCSVRQFPDVANFTSYPCSVTVKSQKRTLSVEFQTIRNEEFNITEKVALLLEMICEAPQGESLINGVLSFGPPPMPSHCKENINEDMLSILKCMQCSKFVLPPIFHCIGAQGPTVLCIVCQRSHMCSNERFSHRNINMDKMANLLDYPCEYRSNGCSFIAKPAQMSKHEAVCEFGTIPCPLGEFGNCLWKGARNAVKYHIESTHQEPIENGTELTKLSQPSRMKYDVVKYANHLFRLVFQKIGDRFCWVVQIIGHSESNFTYQLEVLDANKPGAKLLVRKACTPVKKVTKELYKESHYYCYFLNDQIAHLLNDQNITYKVTIFRNV